MTCLLTPLSNHQDGKKPIFAARPAYNDKDKPVIIRVNQYRVEQANAVKVYQYAVSVAKVCLIL